MSNSTATDSSVEEDVLAQFMSSLYTNGITALIVIMVFNYLRKHFPRTYMPRTLDDDV